jgi:hypothetical protein
MEKCRESLRLLRQLAYLIYQFLSLRPFLAGEPEQKQSYTIAYGPGGTFELLAFLLMFRSGLRWSDS